MTRTDLRLVVDNADDPPPLDDLANLQRGHWPEVNDDGWQRGQWAECDPDGYGWHIDGDGKIEDSEGHRSWETAEAIPDPFETPCPHCGAGPRRFCLTSGGWITPPHAARRKAVVEQHAQPTLRLVFS